MNRINTRRHPVYGGFAAVFVPILFASLFAVGTTVIYATTQASLKAKLAATKPQSIPKKPPVTKLPKIPSQTSVQKALDGIRVNVPPFDFSTSPIPDMKIAPLNLAIPQLPGKGMLKNFGVDSNVGYQDGGVNIEIPKVDVSYMIPNDTPEGVPSEIPTVPVTTPSSPTTAPTQTNQSDCAQFSGVPSCSYVSDPNGQTLCTQCKSAGY